jgi:hypothetical protein
MSTTNALIKIKINRKFLVTCDAMKQVYRVITFRTVARVKIGLFCACLRNIAYTGY